MTQEALKLALEAMESVTVECNNFHHPKKDQNHHWAKCPPVARWDKAITAIKEALAQPEPVGDDWTPCMKLPVVVYVRKQRLGESHVSTREGITPVKPDDLIMRGVSGEEYPIGRAIFEQTYSLNTAPPQLEQEPVALPTDGYFVTWGEEFGGIGFKESMPNANYKITVTAVPQRTWVGLTDEERSELVTLHHGWNEYGQAIEAKLKEKNNG